MIQTDAQILLELGELSAKNISELAYICYADWRKRGKGVNFAALPYLNAMTSLGAVSDTHGADDGRGIVAYFLSNAGSWRGPTARVVKAELKRRLK